MKMPNMNFLKLDWKKLLLEKGEKIALGTALTLGSLLLLTSLFWPGKGFFSSSSTKNAEKLTSQVTQVKNRMSSPSNVPSGADAPAKEKLESDNLPRLKKFSIPDPEKYQVANLFDVPLHSDGQRRQPMVLKPTGAMADVYQERMASYFIQNDDKGDLQIMVLENAPDRKSSSGNTAQQLAQLSMMMMQQRGAAGGRGGATGGKGSPGAGMGMGGAPNLMNRFGGPGGGLVASGDNSPKEYKTTFKPLTEITDRDRLARRPIPLRVGIIAFQFPYRAQLEEFRSKLHLPSISAVQTEMAKSVSPGSTETPPSFRFIGVDVQRREINALGEPVKKGPDNGWQPLDFDKDFKPFIIISGRETQPDDPLVEQFGLPGAVMPLLKLLNKEDKYPQIETRLPGIQQEIAKLKTTNENEVHALPPAFRDGNNLIFGGGSKRGTDPRAGGGGSGVPAVPVKGGLPSGNNPGISSSGVNPPTPAVPSKTRGPGMGSPPPGGGRSSPGFGLAAEHLLGRIVDVTVEAGKIYEYRLQVRMANPNFGRDDVANPSFAESPELEPDPNSWYVVPDKVVVPSDWKYYVVDPEKTKIDPKNQVAFQIHRWVERQNDDIRRGRPIGDWAVAEKVIVNVGQFIGRMAHVELPIWYERMDAFIIPSEKDERNLTRSGINVNFAHPKNEAILVDIDGPDSSTYNRGTNKVKDDINYEAVVLSDDGKLLVHNSERDRKSEERIKRLTAWKDRVKAIKGTSGTPTGPGSLFGR